MSAVSSQQSAVSSSNCLLKFLVNSLKVIVSGILALIVLSIGCFFYYKLLSLHTDQDNVTDCRYDANAFYSLGTEGFACGHTNNEGYVNVGNYTPGMNIEVLIMGSSHMEALNVMQKNSSASILDSKYGMRVYNIAISGQNFATCASSLKAAVKKYKPSRFVVIEVASISLAEKNAVDVIYNRIPRRPAYDKGLLSTLRSIWYLRLMYKQYIAHSFGQFFRPNMQSKGVAASPETLSKMLGNLNEAVSFSGAKLIIAYHPSISLNKDGTLSINYNHENIRLFSDLCAENGIYFLNMAERFLSEYEKSYTLPYGFINTSVGKGHMNAEGHRMFADEIYALIKRIEARS